MEKGSLTVRRRQRIHSRRCSRSEPKPSAAPRDSDKFAFGPFIGARFNHYRSDGYRLSGGDQVDGYEYNQWQFPLGLRFDWKFSAPDARGWQHRQTLELSYIRSAGDVEVTRGVRPSGYGSSVNCERLTYENFARSSVRTRRKNFTGSLNLSGRLSDNQRDWGVG